MPSSFDIEIDRRGGVAELATLPNELQQLASFVLSACTQTRDAINASELLYPLGDIRIELVRNDEFNAFAHHDNGSEGIAIFLGLFENICLRAHALWSEKGLLSSPPVGHRAEEILKHILPSEVIQEWRNIPQSKLTADQLTQRQINTAVTGLLFVFMHEVGHLVQAHIPFLDRRTSLGIRTLFEHGNPNFIATNKELQHLEIDADDHAVRAIIDFAMTTWNMGRIFPINFDYPKGDVFTYLVDIFRGIALAQFCIDEQSPDGKLEAGGSHPTPGIRAGLTALVAGTLLDHPFEISREITFCAHTAAYIEIGDLYTAMGSRAPTFEHDLRTLIKIAGDKIVEAHSFLVDKKVAVDARLRLLGADPLHFDQFAEFYNKNQNQIKIKNQ